MEEWQRLSGLIFDLTERYAGKLVIKITDAQSPQAMWKAIRHGGVNTRPSSYKAKNIMALTKVNLELIDSKLPQATRWLERGYKLAPDMAAENSGSLEHQDT